MEKRFPKVSGAHASLVLATCLACGGARADTYGLIMWIGDYSGVNALVGIDKDAKMAREMFAQMGVPDSHVTELSNHQLTLPKLSSAINELTDRIRPGDSAVIYSSSHGYSLPPSGGTLKKCSDAIVSVEGGFYMDRDITDALNRLASKASSVVMFNDSCHSGGDATKAFNPGSPALRAKAFEKPGVSPEEAAKIEEDCRQAVNDRPISKSFEVEPNSPGPKLLYIAAAAANQAAFPTPQGSRATLAWAKCIKSPAADTDHSGSISGSEFVACAQAALNADHDGREQTITPTGNLDLKLSSPEITNDFAAAPIDPQKTLADIRAGADTAYQVALTPGMRTVRIGKDFLTFTVQTKRDGYLYVLQVGSDGKTFNLLFPNDVDQENYLRAGSYRFPRDTWRLRSAGPAGSNHLLVLSSPTPRDFAGQMRDRAGFFRTTPAESSQTKSFVAEAIGAGHQGGGKYGTSEVEEIVEVAP